MQAEMITSIDTLEIAKRLRDSGIGEKQEAITGALRYADLSRLATKEDCVV